MLFKYHHAQRGVRPLPRPRQRRVVRGQQRRDYTPKGPGFELHDVLNCGDPTFDVRSDHPAWIRHVSRHAGEQGTYVQGIMIDESIATSRGSGGHHPVHSGGHDASIRTQYAYRNGAFRCGQVNVLVSLRDVGPGDGATMVVPGSHKSNLMHPLAGYHARAIAWTHFRSRPRPTPRPVTPSCSSTRACTVPARASTRAIGAS